MCTLPISLHGFSFLFFKSEALGPRGFQSLQQQLKSVLSVSGQSQLRVQLLQGIGSSALWNEGYAKPTVLAVERYGQSHAPGDEFSVRRAPGTAETP